MAKHETGQYELENATEEIAGYFLPKPYEPDGMEAVFLRARAECVGHLRIQLSTIESLDFATYCKQRKGRQSLPRPVETEHG